MEKELTGIRYQSGTYAKLETLMNRVNEEAIKEAHRNQEKNKAVGVDGIAKTDYGARLTENVAELISRMKKFSYRPQPVRRTYIPKANGKLRPLGIPAYEDRLVQSVMAGLLCEVYEERFLDCSYGYRPGRSAHDAVRVINETVMTGKVNCVLEADIKGFFDNVNHEWLMKFLENDIADPNFLRYVKRFLIAGIMEGTEFMPSDKGTPQGGQMSPVLANVYLHYVLDLWVTKALRQACKGEVYYVRYADDFVVMFQYESEADRAMAALRARLLKFGLELSEDKTRTLPFGRYGGGKESFDFLGFTFFNTTARTGKYRLGVRTSAKKLKAKRQDVKAWLKTRLHERISATMEKIQQSLRGHVNYYGVSGNSRIVQKFWQYVKYTCFRILNRRHQKRSMRVDVFERIWTHYVSPPKITVNIWTKPKLA